MKSLPGILIILAASFTATGCSGRSNADTDTTGSIPRPKGWPRTELYDTVYRPVAPDADILAPEGSIAAVEGRSITITYPAYRATLFITDSRAASSAEADAIEANRLERINLNIGGRTTELSELTTIAGYDARIFSTPQGTLTPLQFVARGERRVVSGVLVMDRLPLSADSFAPTLQAVERDALRIISSLDTP